MNRKEFQRLFQWAKRVGIKYILGTPTPGWGIQSLQVTGGGTGTDTVTFASTYTNGDALANMANTSYHVLMGFSANPAGTYVGTKTTTGFVVTGLALNETVDLLVIGTISGMPDFT
jgi:hypothetical protein